MKYLIIAVLLPCFGSAVEAGIKTWDGKYDLTNLEVTVVYFVPSDRPPLIDWRDRVDYFCQRIEQFHAREFQGQSAMKTVVHPQPLVSESTTAQLRIGDPNAIYRRTLSETDRRLKFAKDKSDVFRILLVLGEINWRPLDDFYRLHPQNGKLVFEGYYNQNQHFPGARSGGSRAAYIADRGIGWGLVSADGWRVPYRGSDNVIYHEGCGHTVGLPHPEPGNGSVMSQAQYRGWLSESWLDKEQKLRLGWEPGEAVDDLQIRLFTKFKAIPEPLVPRPNETVRLNLNWPHDVDVQKIRLRYQTAIDGPWINVPQPPWEGDTPDSILLGNIDRETPVSFRIDVTLKGGQTAELWSYFQVRSDPKQWLFPRSLSPDLVTAIDASSTLGVDAWPTKSIDLLKLADPETCWTAGKWNREDTKLVSPKQFGARLELPYSPPNEYRLTLIVEPLDKPHGLILGQRSGSRRFAALFNHHANNVHRSAIENIDGRNVGNETTFEASMFQQNQLSQVEVIVREKQITMSVDGRTIVNWHGNANRLSLSDYWKTPNESNLFLGTYDCRYRFHRVSLVSLSDE